MGENNNKISAGGRGPSPSAMTQQNIKNAQLSAQAQAKTQPTSNGQNINYWLGEVDNVGEIIKSCTLNFKAIIESIKKMHKELSNLVNVENGWNDDNSVIFAQWWNEGTHKLLTFNNDKIEIVSNVSPGSLRYIINKCAKLYWMVVCNQLYFVTCGKYVTKKQLFSSVGFDLNSIYELGKDTQYLDALTLTEEDTIWGEMIKKIPEMEYFNWKDVQLNSTKHGEESVKNALVEICQKFGTSCIEFTEAVKMFLEQIKKIENDKWSKMYFGIEPNEKLKLAIHDAKIYINTTMDSFGTNIGEVLKNYDDKVSKDIMQYFDRNMLIV